MVGWQPVNHRRENPGFRYFYFPVWISTSQMPELTDVNWRSSYASPIEEESCGLRPQIP